MSGINWGLAVPQGNPGQAFMQAFEQGRQRRREIATDDALRALAANPDDEQALSNYMRFDPRGGMQFRQQRQQQQAQAQERQRENIIMGAKLVRQANPQDEAGWQQTLGMAQRLGLDLTGVPTQFDPNYIKQLVATADALDPQKRENAPSSYEEYQRAQADPAYAKFLEERRGPIVANNGDGTFTLIPRNMAGPQQASAPPPPPPGFVIDGDGGQTGSAPSGNFPR